jgi:hypothetical protein
VAVVGVVAPGTTGTAPGACLGAGGHRVLTSLAGRSPAAADRPRPVVEDVGSLDVAAVDVVLAVVPPGAARAAGGDPGGPRPRPRG